jgi:hypothetical protein
MGRIITSSNIPGELWRAFCDVLGIDHDGVTEVTVELRIDRPVEVTVRRYAMTRDYLSFDAPRFPVIDQDHFKELLQRYELVLRDETPITLG